MDYLNLLTELKTAVIPLAKAHLLPDDSQIQRQTKRDGSFVTAVDHAMQQAIIDKLAELTPEIARLGEEMDGEQQQALFDSHEYLWCIDPLDGTTNFASHLPYYCVSIALLKNKYPVLGLVYDPIRDEAFSAIADTGAWLNDKALNLAPTGLQLSECIGLIDFKRLAPNLRQQLIENIPYVSQRSYGSGALDWCWIAAGRCQLYLHGRQNLWDYAAGQLILTEAGGHSLTIEAEKVCNGQLSKRSVMAAVDKTLFEAWAHWIKQANAD